MTSPGSVFWLRDPRDSVTFCHNTVQLIMLRPAPGNGVLADVITVQCSPDLLTMDDDLCFMFAGIQVPEHSHRQLRGHRPVLPGDTCLLNICLLLHI